ncbi:MAG TPA: hypothetical protein VEI29_03165, partial [Burkholderiaceae bacterium]|nr:hypothetical protein [Burkholderiaceae bacterium]
MKIALEWLREFFPTQEDPAAIAERLTMGGLEVEEPDSAPNFSEVVVGRVVEVRRHPNADRLSVCQVDTGEPTLRT